MASGFGIVPWLPQLSFNALGTVNTPWTGRGETEWVKPSLFVDITTSLERAGFDYLLIEDTSYIHDAVAGTMDTTLKLGLYSPKNDPMPLVPLLAERTKHIGIVPTVTTTFYHPYMASRLFATLDHLTEGRVGFNLVTGTGHRAVQNYGMDQLPPKAERYAMAHEWVDVFKALQESWEPDAILADVENGVYADYTKVHTIDHQGKYYKVRGPLNTIPGPQRYVPMVQAGNSSEGRDISARHGEVLLAVASSIESMKALREDMHKRMRAYGRDPSTLKIMFMVDLVLGMTDEEAQARAAALKEARWNDLSMQNMFFYLSANTRMDFSKYNPEMPFEEVYADIQKHQNIDELISVMKIQLSGVKNKTLREALATISLWPDLDLVGSPETVAAKMDEVMQEVGGDGFLITAPSQRVAVAEICDGLAPVLRRRGSIRSGYDGKTFRENLQAF
ncbi:NtaA/DmoA family FMN-dependent monooxygenase [Mesorhizobium sp. 2RAF21]